MRQIDRQLTLPILPQLMAARAGQKSQLFERHGSAEFRETLLQTFCIARSNLCTHLLLRIAELRNSGGLKKHFHLRPC